jgi:protein phosphatase 2C family protein 2/3
MEAEKRFINKADSKKPNHDRSGSCAIIILTVNEHVYVANVGDSRAIMSANQGK